MATFTLKDGYEIDLDGTYRFDMKIHPGDKEYFHIHALGSGIQESIWKKKNMEDATRDANDITKYVIEEGLDVVEDDITGRIVPSG